MISLYILIYGLFHLLSTLGSLLSSPKPPSIIQHITKKQTKNLMHHMSRLAKDEANESSYVQLDRMLVLIYYTR